MAMNPIPAASPHRDAKNMKFEIRSVRFFPGCQAGLDERTALVQIAVSGIPEDWRALEARFRAEADSLRPSEPLWGVGDAGWPGAFLMRRRGAGDPAEWVVALTIAFQRWARRAVWQGRVLDNRDGLMRLAMPHAGEALFRDALDLALRHLAAWSDAEPGGEDSSDLARIRDAWLERAQAAGLPPNTLRFYAAAKRRGIPAVEECGAIRLGWGRQAELFDSSFTGRTPQVATRLARNKHLAGQLLAAAGVPVPRGSLAANLDAARRLAEQFGWPVVVKPANLDQGLGVVPGIRDTEALARAFQAADALSPGAVLVERHVSGADHRMLVVGGRLLMASRRIPGGVTGDGRCRIAELVERVNADPLRGSSKRSLLIRIAIDDEARACLAEQGLDQDSVPEAGRFVPLRRTANISTGGTALDVTARVHPDNRLVVERAARRLGLDIAGVDFLCPDIGRSWREVGGAVCEVNAQPGFRPHWLGDPGRDINGEIVDWVYRGRTPRIPVAAVTGTNGKTTTARMLQRIWLAAGRQTGVCTTSGSWIGDDLISSRNQAGLSGARMLLEDPTMEAAVIEMPRQALIEQGHPCDRYDVAVLLNVQDDHIGVDGIRDMAHMARLKAGVLERATRAVVLNAEDPLVMQVGGNSPASRRILVAAREDAPALAEHLKRGGAGVFLRRAGNGPWIVLAERGAETALMPAADIPATMCGQLPFNEINALFAVALAWGLDLPPAAMRAGLSAFVNSPRGNIGRYNFIEAGAFRILLDFGHNPDGVRALCALVAGLPVAGRRCLLNLKLGNRHRAHLDAMAPLLAENFGHFMLGCDPAYVHKAPDWQGEDPPGLMLDHARRCLLAAGVAPEAIALEGDPALAVRRALDGAKPGDLLVLLADPWLALPVIEQFLGRRLLEA